MSIEELSKVENIIWRIEVYICSRIPLIPVTAEINFQLITHINELHKGKLKNLSIRNEIGRELLGFCEG